MEQGNYMDFYLSGEIVKWGTFDVNDFCKLSSTFEYYDIMKEESATASGP